MVPAISNYDLIVGLGNVGQRYAGTRHNVGFEVVDAVAKQIAVGPRRADDLYYWCSAEHGRHLLTLVWPRTYMNRSGQAVVDLLDRLETSVGRMLVVVDDFNLPLGSIRFRSRGSDGGHNGLASLIEDLGTEDFPRCRIGIGEPADEEDVVDYVLGRFAEAEREVIDPIISTVAEGVIFAIDHHFDEVMSTYNRNPAQPD
jgi:PTH1 family peptidyl-tRNA hydrolase